MGPFITDIPSADELHESSYQRNPEKVYLKKTILYEIPHDEKKPLLVPRPGLSTQSRAKQSGKSRSGWGF